MQRCLGSREETEPGGSFSQRVPSQMRMYASRRPDAPVMEAAILAGPAMGAVADWSLMRESRAGVTEDVSSSRKRKQ